MTVHAAIEVEIFYPVFLAATKDKDMHHEAIIEHDGAKNSSKHHVKEEEQKDGMFDEAKQSRKMNLAELGTTVRAQDCAHG